ncbi:uncharacterized protein FIBRA_06002 [Fibroporia radiculosa]|uniref:SEC7 domain-containing protein n=1 Tax=Fibroporia radiculosa TaxID=599839 RepID=J4GAH3_9APHY|nr:uncharacterized protein FIBRA_06002 [Fibroporia radiculosa]CCM03853.1 predicted protein [Fibroporia radiculosa]
MRKNSRWALPTHSFSTRQSALASSMGLRRVQYSSEGNTSHRGNTEQDLMSGFQDLKRLVKDTEDVQSLPLPTILGPFFAIIRSPLSTGPITSAALTALHSFFVCSLISSSSIALRNTLAELSSAISRCKFETSDSSGDEVVLLKIMAVIQDAICGPVGPTLGDIEARLSEILRRSAEATMHSLVWTVCSRLHVLDPATEEGQLSDNGYDADEQEGRMSLPTTMLPTESVSSSVEHDSDTKSEQAVEDQQGPVTPPSRQIRHQYGLASIIELLRVIIHVLDPNDQLHTDSIRLTALRILNVIFEASGSRICEFPSLCALVVDQGCKFLFQLARSDNSAVLQTTLRTTSTMFETMRRKLKLQQELFLAFTIDRLAPPPSAKSHAGLPNNKSSSASPRPATPIPPGLDGDSDKAPPTPRILVAPARGDTRELILETLSQISRHPSFMVDLFVNYDCDMNCENMFERLIEFATKGIYPSQAIGGQQVQQQNAQDLCLDIILSFVNHMASRAEGHSDQWPADLISIDDLQLTKSRKKLVLTGMARFNTKPKTGLSFLEENRLIYLDPNEPRPLSLAKFLKNSARVDKRLLGDFLSKPDNIDVLKAFMGLFDFKDKSVADAMRELLETFRLPGESQQINRITETFAEVYISTQPAEVKSQDAVYVLAYSIIMLNTDLHSPQIRKRMSIDDYKRNLKGVNDGTDFSPEYLQAIYDSIRKREIIMPEEHTGQAGFEYAWKELLTRARQTGDLIMCNSSQFDIDMFKTVWKPVVSAIAYAFITFEDDYIIERAITGFRQCATLARHFDLPDVFDYVVVQLSQATGLISEMSTSQIPNYPVLDIDGQSVTVSSLSVKFGTNLKGQLAAVVLFNIVNGNGNALREGWTQIFEMFQTLFVHSLLPTRMLQMEDFLGGVSIIPLRRSQPARPAPRSDGLLSALSSYLMTPYGSSTETLVPEATDADMEKTLSTIDCITSCRLDELYSQIMQLDLNALVAAVRALEALAHERTVARLKQESDDVPSGYNTPQEGPYALPYDPASVFLLETMVSIACQTPQYIEDLWPIIFEHLSALLSTPVQYSILLIERAVVGLLRVCNIITSIPSLRDQLFVSFDLLAGLPVPVSSAVAEQVVGGLSMLARNCKDLANSPTEWNLVFALIRSTIPHPEASRQSFELVAALAGDGPEQRVSPDNFPGLIAALDEFATAAGVAVESQQQGRRNQTLNASNSPVVDRGRKAIDMLADLKKFWARFADASVPADQTWQQFCLPLVLCLGRQCINVSREVRHAALVHLQRILLGPHLPLDIQDHAQTEELFSRVLFPLVDDLLKPHVLMRDPMSLPETRLRVSALLCKTFMHLEAREGQSTDIRDLWIQVLDLLDRLMHVDRRDPLREAIPESLKNVVLVMSATGLLVPPSQPDKREDRQKQLWTATEERIGKFLPGFLAEVLPSPAPSPVRASKELPPPLSVPSTPIPS